MIIIERVFFFFFLISIKRVNTMVHEYLNSKKKIVHLAFNKNNNNNKKKSSYTTNRAIILLYFTADGNNFCGS